MASAASVPPHSAPDFPRPLHPVCVCVCVKPPSQSLMRMHVMTFRVSLDSLGPSYVMIINLVVSAKTLFPYEVTDAGPRD